MLDKLRSQEAGRAGVHAKIADGRFAFADARFPVPFPKYRLGPRLVDSPSEQETARFSRLSGPETCHSPTREDSSQGFDIGLVVPAVHAERVQFHQFAGVILIQPALAAVA